MNETDIAQIYVPCALTHVPDNFRRTLKTDIEHIVRAVSDMAAKNGWRLYAYDPISHTAPYEARNQADSTVSSLRPERKDGSEYTPDEIWELDTRKVLVEADGIIAHGYDGGSAGVGMELYMAASRGIPILYLHHETTQVSRMVRGMPGSIDVREFVVPSGSGSREHLVDLVDQWLQSNSQAILDGPRRRAIQAALVRDVVTALRKKWHTAQTNGDAERLAETAGFTSKEVELLLSDELRVAALPHVRLLMLSHALEGEGESSGRELTTSEIDWLNRAAEEYTWGDGFKEALVQAARQRQLRKVSRASSGRHNLESIDGWASFADDWIAGRLG